MDNIERSASNSNYTCKNSLEGKNFGAAHKNQNMLPLKKRFGIYLGDSSLNLATRPYDQDNPWIEMQKDNNKDITEEDKKLLKPEPKKAKILPGVIRHTSCPNNTLAYYYNYSVK
jgi:hypothetical protein